MLEPIFSVIFGDDGPLSVLARPQPSRSDLFVCLRSSDVVVLAELSDAHGSLPGTPPSFCLRNYRFHEVTSPLSTGIVPTTAPACVRTVPKQTLCGSWGATPRSRTGVLALHASSRPLGGENCRIPEVRFVPDLRSENFAIDRCQQLLER